VQLGEQQGMQQQQQQQQQYLHHGLQAGALDAGSGGLATDSAGGRPSVFARLGFLEQQQQEPGTGGPDQDADLVGLADLADEKEEGEVVGAVQGSGRHQQGGQLGGSHNPNKQIEADMGDSEALISGLEAEAEEELKRHSAGGSRIPQQQQGVKGPGGGVGPQPNRPPAHLLRELRRRLVVEMARSPHGHVLLCAASDPGQLCPKELARYKLVRLAARRCGGSILGEECVHVHSQPFIDSFSWIGVNPSQSLGMCRSRTQFDLLLCLYQLEWCAGAKHGQKGHITWHSPQCKAPPLLLHWEPNLGVINTADNCFHKSCMGMNFGANRMANAVLDTGAEAQIF
jgi:hypothetical protein